MTDFGQCLANYLPRGRAWVAKNIDGSNLRQLLNAFGYEFSRMEAIVQYLKRELDLSQTQDLIDLWEQAFGIPDNCFSNAGLTIAQRLLNILIKLYMNGADEFSDWEYIASLLGYGGKVTVQAGRDTTYPFGSQKEAMYSIVVTFNGLGSPNYLPVTLPFTLSGDNLQRLKNVYNELKPCNSQIIYIYT